MAKIKSRLVDEVPPSHRGTRVSKYVAAVEEAKLEPGQIREFGPLTPSQASGMITALRSLADYTANQRSREGGMFVYVTREEA